MATIDLIGVPIPVDDPEFSRDKKLLRKIKKLESLIEIEHDIRDAKEALMALQNSMIDENWETIAVLFSCVPLRVSESLLSYCVVLYAKAFASGTGRTKLEEQKIFGKDDIDKHEYMMSLRNGFYAHHGIEANRHQLFCLPNNPTKGKVKLRPRGQSTRVIMPSWVNLEKIEFCIMKVEKYLIDKINDLCTSIENEMDEKQLKILTETPKTELMSQYWRENKESRIDPFSTRKKSQ